MGKYKKKPPKKTRTCIRCKKEFPATFEYFYRLKKDKNWLHSYCKKCYGQVAREVVKRRALKDTGMTCCAVCNHPYEMGKRFVRHHINYKKEKMVLLCKSCHDWLHGKAIIFKHPFKEKFNPDIAPFEFAKKVVELYMEHDPRMWETVKINLKKLEDNNE